MKKFIVALALVSLVAVGALAYAHGPGGGWGSGHMMSQGYGGHMMGSMMGWGGYGYGYDKKFLDESVDLRKELHNKKFEYFEAMRDPKTTTETITKLEKEIRELQEKIYEKAPRSSYGGHMMGPGFAGFGC